MPLLTTELCIPSAERRCSPTRWQYCEYAVVTPDGKRRTQGTNELLPFGLQRNYWGNPLGVGVGFKPWRLPVNDFGKIATRQERDRCR